MNENTISYKLDRIKNATDRMRVKTGVVNGAIENVASAVEELSIINNQDKEITTNGIYSAEEGYTGLGTINVNVSSSGSDINVTNGTLDSGYYSSSGTIAPGTFINTSVITESLSPSDLGLTESDWDNAIYGIHYLKDDYYILRSYYYFYIFKGTTKICAEKMKDSEGRYTIYSTEDGKNIFMLPASTSGGCGIYHYKFENNLLQFVSSMTVESLGSGSFHNVNGFTCISNDGTNYKFLLMYSYDAYPYAVIIDYDGTTWTEHNKISLSSYRCASSYDGFEPVQIDQNNYLFANKNDNSDSFYKGMYKITVAEDNTLTKTELGGISLIHPILAKIGNKCVVCAKGENTTIINLIVYDLLNNANIVYSNQISAFNSNEPTNSMRIKIVNINDSNFLIIHGYNDGTNDKIKCIPCVLNDDGSVNIGTPQELNKRSEWYDAAKFGTGNAINITEPQTFVSGTLDGLQFNIGVKYVSQATGSITGITKTECTESVPGDIYLLNTEAASNE